MWEHTHASYRTVQVTALESQCAECSLSTRKHKGALCELFTGAPFTEMGTVIRKVVFVALCLTMKVYSGAVPSDHSHDKGVHTTHAGPLAFAQ